MGGDFETFRTIRAARLPVPGKVRPLSALAQLLWEHLMDRSNTEGLTWCGDTDCAQALGRPGQERAIRRAKKELEAAGAIAKVGFHFASTVRTMMYRVYSPSVVEAEAAEGCGPSEPGQI